MVELFSKVIDEVFSLWPGKLVTEWCCLFFFVVLCAVRYVDHESAYLKSRELQKNKKGSRNVVGRGVLLCLWRVAVWTECVGRDIWEILRTCQRWCSKTEWHGVRLRYDVCSRRKMNWASICEDVLSQPYLQKLYKRIPYSVTVLGRCRLFSVEYCGKGSRSLARYVQLFSDSTAMW